MTSSGGGKAVTFQQLGKVLIIFIACIGVLTGAAGYLENRINVGVDRVLERSYPKSDGVSLQTLVGTQQETLRKLADNQEDLIKLSEKLDAKMEMLMELTSNKNDND